MQVDAQDFQLLNRLDVWGHGVCGGGGHGDGDVLAGVVVDQSKFGTHGVGSLGIRGDEGIECYT